ncbi:ZDH21-like protein [Mya arenaria]|uniref:Palmitoyltransferase n=1 Tax=Mya arenaria TaxID=6604 RepID=A0ABY7FR28_MYAAR|nr:ZDH21-like protein [Mya arenaria]
MLATLLFFAVEHLKMDVKYPITDPNDSVLVNLRQSLAEQAAAYRLQENTNTINIPLLGHIHFVRDKNGIMMLSCIVAYWVYGVWSSYYVVLNPHYVDGVVPTWYMCYHFLVCALCLLALIRSATLNPGRVPDIDANVAQSRGWEPCPTCGKWRPPKAHHCRRCKQCVVRMDHHCPWINNCVGDGNHHVFTLLLFYAFLFGLNGFIALMLHYWYWPKCEACDKNMTSLETMKIKSVHDVNYDTVQLRTCCKAYTDLFGTFHFYLWPWPCRRKRSRLSSLTIWA